MSNSQVVCKTSKTKTKSILKELKEQKDKNQQKDPPNDTTTIKTKTNTLGNSSNNDVYRVTNHSNPQIQFYCLLYTSDAADE